MSRLWNGSTSLMTFPGSASFAMNDALTVMAGLRIMNTNDTAWQSFVEFWVGASLRLAFGRNNSGNLYFANSASTSSAVNVTDADNWMEVWVTRSAAAATTFHKVPIGGSRTSTAGGALADGLTAASATVRVGGDSDPANIKVSVLAYWNGVEITTGQIDGVHTALSTQSILDLSPSWAADDSDAFVTDLTAGTLNQATDNTVDDADDPAGWTYFGGAAAEVIPSLVMAPPNAA